MSECECMNIFVILLSIVSGNNCARQKIAFYIILPSNRRAGQTMLLENVLIIIILYMKLRAK